MKLTTIKGSENYQCQVIKLPTKIPVKGLDNLVEVNYQGNSCLIGKDSNEDELYLFFPAECKISSDFLKANNLYRHSELNQDTTQKCFFEDSGRVKALKFKGIISTGFIIPLKSLEYKGNLQIGDEFNEIDDVKICEKYHKPAEKKIGMKNPRTKTIDNIVDSRMVPEHTDTSHLLKNIHKLSLDDYVAITYKLHGTSARYYHTLVKKRFSVIAKLISNIAEFFGVKVVKEGYDYVSASRRVVKSVGFEELPDKQHFFTSGDLWSEVGKQYFQGNLNQGEAVYCEIIGKTYSGEAIQHGYTYGFQTPKVYIYRISNINPQGIEIDLPYHQMITRANQLGVEVCPEFFYGKLRDFVQFYTMGSNLSLEENLDRIFHDRLLEKSSILDHSVLEEGFVIRKDTYGKPEMYKIKAKSFLMHESKVLDNIKNTDLEENS